MVEYQSQGSVKYEAGSTSSGGSSYGASSSAANAVSEYGSDGRPPGCCGKGCCSWGRRMRGWE